MSSIVSSLSDEESSGPSHHRQRDENANASGLMPPGSGSNTINQRAAAQRLLSEDEAGLGKQPRFQEKQFGSEAGERPHSGNPSLLQDWWIWEIVAVMLSLASTAAIIIILAVYDGHPLPSWPYKITLNAIISVLSTVAKASMLFAIMECIGQSKWMLFRQGQHDLLDFHSIDGASRGPLDSLLLLYRIKGRALIASAGAFVVVLSLAVDPFTQQVLSYPSKLNETQAYANPSLPLVTSWTTPGNATVFESASTRPASMVPLGMRAAIYNSILGLGQVNSTLNLNCPTGNCTFDQADTLGFCSTCVDVTQQVKVNCSTSHKNDTPDKDPAYDVDNTNCTYHLPGGIDILVENTQIPNDFQSAMSQSKQYRRTTNMSSIALQRESALIGATLPSEEHVIVTTGGVPKSTFLGVPAPLLGFGRIVFNGSYTPVPEVGGNILPNATECAMSWCVQTLQTSIRNGTLSQNITSTWTNSSGFDTGAVTLRTEANAPGYFVSEMSNIPLASFLELMFTANMSGVELPGTGRSEKEIFDLSMYSSDTAQALWFADDLSGLMNNLADRMTDTLRNSFADPARNTNGTVLIERVYVHVSWLWLILPIALVLLSCGILLAAIISTTKHRAILWKNSSLATLFHGLTASEGETGHLMYKKQMESAARGIQVSLEGDAGDAIHLAELRKHSASGSSVDVR